MRPIMATGSRIATRARSRPARDSFVRLQFECIGTGRNNAMTDQRESLCDQARADEARRASPHRSVNPSATAPTRVEQQATREQPCVRDVVFAADMGQHGFGEASALGVVQGGHVAARRYGARRPPMVTSRARRPRCGPRRCKAGRVRPPAAPRRSRSTRRSWVSARVWYAPLTRNCCTRKRRSRLVA